MNKKTMGIVLAYVAGQVTQLVIHGVVLANNMYNYRQIPFCLAGGFVILFAILSGVWIAGAKDAEAVHLKDKNLDEEIQEKEYERWAKAPEKSGTVIDPFAVVKEFKAAKEAD